MSANNQLVIIKVKNGYTVRHIDIDSGKDSYGKFPFCDTLEEAVKIANKFERESLAEGIGIEYGLKIIL